MQETNQCTPMEKIAQAGRVEHRRRSNYGGKDPDGNCFVPNHETRQQTRPEERVPADGIKQQRAEQQLETDRPPIHHDRQDEKRMGDEEDRREGDGRNGAEPKPEAQRQTSDGDEGKQQRQPNREGAERDEFEIWNVERRLEGAHISHGHQRDFALEHREGAPGRIVNRLEEEGFILVKTAPTGDDPAENEQAEQAGRANKSHNPG